MPVSAHDVARELRAELPFSGRAKVHKLLYMCQGWHLAWYGEPMFVEDIEAWDNGPVVADLWRDEDRTIPAPAAERLGGGQLLVLDYVVNHYGALSGRELIDLTHNEGPWHAAYQRHYTQKTISVDELRDHFIQAEREDRQDGETGLDDRAIQDMLRRANDMPSAAHQTHDETDDIRRWVIEVAG